MWWDLNLFPSRLSIREAWLRKGQIGYQCTPSWQSPKDGRHWDVGSQLPGYSHIAEWTYSDSKMQIGEMTPWVQSILHPIGIIQNWVQCQSSIHFQPQWIQMNHLVLRYATLTWLFQCWRCSPLVRIGLGWSSMDHQIHHPSTSTEAVRNWRENCYLPSSYTLFNAS